MGDPVPPLDTSRRIEDSSAFSSAINRTLPTNPLEAKRAQEVYEREWGGYSDRIRDRIPETGVYFADLGQRNHVYDGNRIEDTSAIILMTSVLTQEGKIVFGVVTSKGPRGFSVKNEKERDVVTAIIRNRMENNANFPDEGFNPHITTEKTEGERLLIATGNGVGDQVLKFSLSGISIELITKALIASQDTAQADVTEKIQGNRQRLAESKTFSTAIDRLPPKTATS